MSFTSAEEARLKLRAGDLLLCEGGDVGRTAIWNGEMEQCYYQNHLHRLRAKVANEIDPQFALYWFWYAFEVAKVYVGRSNVTTIPNLSQSKLSELQIPKPEIAEQRRIAYVLNTVQTAIEQQARLIALTRELKSALMQKLFTEGLRGEKQKMTEIGPVPESWEEKSIGDIVNVTKLAGFEYTKYVKYVEDGEIIAIRGLNLKNGQLDLRNVKRVYRSVSNSLPRSQLHIGDVLLSYVGTVGGVAVINEEERYHLAPNVAKLTPKKKNMLHPNFLAYYLISDVGRKELFMNVSKTSQPVISMAKIRNLKIYIPLFKEQQEIVNLIRAFDRKFEVAGKKQILLEELFRTLLHQLMTGQIRVNDIDLPGLS